MCGGGRGVAAPRVAGFLSASLHRTPAEAAGLLDAYLARASEGSETEAVAA